MNIVRTRIISTTQFSCIHKLWNEEYPITLRDRFPLLLEGVVNYHHYIIEDTDQKVIAWAVDFEKESQIRFSIIVASAHKGKGLGTQLIECLKANNDELHGWVIDHNESIKANGETYQSPMSFYLKHDFNILNDIRLDTEMIKAVLIKWTNK